MSPSPAPCSSRRGLPPADPALVQVVDDADDVDLPLWIDMTKYPTAGAALPPNVGAVDSEALVAA